MTEKFHEERLNESTVKFLIKNMASTELVTVNLTRENQNENWGFTLAGGGKDKNARLFISEVRYVMSSQNS